MSVRREPSRATEPLPAKELTVPKSALKSSAVSLSGVTCQSIRVRLVGRIKCDMVYSTRKVATSFAAESAEQPGSSARSACPLELKSPRSCVSFVNRKLPSPLDAESCIPWRTFCTLFAANKLPPSQAAIARPRTLTETIATFSFMINSTSRDFCCGGF